MQGFDDVVKEVSNCQKKFTGSGKSIEVARHDAEHLILSKDLRKRQKPSPLGPDYWFLTVDRSLVCADEIVSKTVYSQDRVPASIHLEFWLELISPLLSQDSGANPIDVFSNLLQSKFAKIPHGLNPSDLIELQGDWLDYKDLEVEDIEEILSDVIVSDYLTKVRQARKSGKDTTLLRTDFGRRTFDQDRGQTEEAARKSRVGDEFTQEDSNWRLEKHTFRGRI